MINWNSNNFCYGCEQPDSCDTCNMKSESEEEMAANYEEIYNEKTGKNAVFRGKITKKFLAWKEEYMASEVIDSEEEEVVEEEELTDEQIEDIENEEDEIDEQEQELQRVKLANLIQVESEYSEFDEKVQELKELMESLPVEWAEEIANDKNDVRKLKTFLGLVSTKMVHFSKRFAVLKKKIEKHLK